MPLDVATLRSLFRCLQAFRSLYETEGVDEIIGPDGTPWNLFDLEYLYEQLPRLPQRQYQAIELCFVQNLKEADAARKMGVSYTNPVSIYANNGLSKLIALIETGKLPRFRPEDYGLELVVTVEVDLREETLDATATPRDLLPAGGRGEPTDPGIASGCDQALSQGRHSDPLERGRQAS